MISRQRCFWLGCVLSLFVVAGCSPRIDNIEPYTARWGETVVISGRCLADGSDNPVSVTFNGMLADFWPVDTDVEAIVPVDASSGPVSVSVANAGLFGCNAGVAESPHAFTVVVDAISEVDSGDDCEGAQLIEGDAVSGALSTATDIDCFEVPTGPAGPYGYVLEFHLSTEGAPSDGDVRYQILDDEAGTVLQTLYVGGHAYDDTDLGWTAQPPASSVYVMLDWVGSTSSTWAPVSYQLAIARLPIEDTAETADNLPGSGAVAVTPGVASVQSRLCSVWASEAPYGDIRDHFSFELDAPKNVSIGLVDAGLPEGDEVHIALLQPSTDTEASTSGDANSVGLNVDLPTIWPRPDEFPYFPEGTWYVYVSNQASSFPSAGPGSAPISCKRPYRLLVDIDD